MSFREIDDDDNEAPRRTSRWPREVKAWLREIFVEDWNLKLLALAITLGLWYAVTGQRTPSTIRLRNVQLQFRLPEEMEISNEPRDMVEVVLTGNKRELDRIKRGDLVAYVDISKYAPGERVVQLTRDSVTMDLPEGVRVDDIEPNVVPLRLEPRVEGLVAAEARLDGKLPDGFELYAVRVVPDKVRVRGPASHINALEKAPTELISLSGRKESFNIQQAAIEISDQRVNVLDTVVNVSLEIGEQRIEKSFAGIPVRESSGATARPEVATVTLYGPRSVIEQLRAETMQILLDEGADGAITPRLILPPEVEGRVALRSTRPSGFSIVR
ncbi:MAG TPA: CdaR family protein [Pyrinomonadaceae bacterium]|jgi:YbbR domain-containing protein|nr:CdaR family protein [Pyrinomonadaceae bacterium]